MNKIPLIQNLLGTTPDGIWGVRSKTALASAPQPIVKQIQALLGVTADGNFGPTSQAALDALTHAATQAWPFAVQVDGEDLIVNNIVITCFGGGFDPQDNGSTASGINTFGSVAGVSLPMDGRQYPKMSRAEHAALDGSPIPKLPWGTLVEVTIGGVKFTPPAGVIDLGPGHQASKPGEPHALDLTPFAAQHFAPKMSLRFISQGFEERGSYRIIGGARFLQA